jgi:hypothetical protein
MRSKRTELQETVRVWKEKLTGSLDQEKGQQVLNIFMARSVSVMRCLVVVCGQMMKVGWTFRVHVWSRHQVVCLEELGWHLSTCQHTCAHAEE